jgi:MSHA biogenesis protein MshQ
MVSWGARALATALLLGAQSALAQVAFVQSTGLFTTTGGSSVTSPAFAAPPTVGNTIVVYAWSYRNASSPTLSASDTGPNTYVEAVQGCSPVCDDNGGGNVDHYNVALLYAPVTATAANLKVTVASAHPNSQIDGIAIEYSGVGAVDRTNTAGGTSATATIATTAATALGNELVASAVNVNLPNQTFASISASAGYASRGFQSNNTTNQAGGGADSVVNSAGVQSATWTGTYVGGGSGFTQWQAAIATFRPASATTPDHFAISYPSGSSAVNCQPQPVTITAHSSSHVAVATTDQITVSTSTGHGDWTLSSGSGTFAAGGANSGTATYTYASADGGAVTLSLRDTVAETVSINVVDGGATTTSGSAIASEHQSMTFSASGFRITNGSNAPTTIAAQVAGKSSTQSLALQAIRTDTSTGACTSVFASGTTVSVSLAYQCNNPTSCVAGQTFSVTNNSTTTSIAANPNSGVTTYTTVPLKFSTANAEAPFSLNYSDVGQVTLYARYNIPLGSGAGSGNYMNGSSQFIVQPYTFVLSGIQCTTYAAGSCNTGLGSPGNNPAASGATGTVFMPAGKSFSATVTAQNFAGNPTPNYGQEISPQGVTLAANLVLPAGGTATALNNAAAFGSFTSGLATGTTFNWPQVGIITLTPSVASYLGSGAVTGTASGNVGRFIPASFGTAVNIPVIGTACAAGSFSYLGQPLSYTVAPAVTVTALAADGVTTTSNYTGAFLKLTNSSLTGRTYTPTPASPALDTSGLPATTSDPTIADLGTGQATLTFGAGSGLKFVRGSAIAPFSANIALAINVIDSDGVTASNPVTFGSGSGIGFSTGATQYYGRLYLKNVAGSELLDLPMSLTTQYYLSSSQGFVTNTSDACTTAPALAFGNYQLNLSAGQTCVRDTGSPGVSGQGCAVAASAWLRYRATAAAVIPTDHAGTSGGDFNLILAAPGSGHSGAMTVTATAPGWLQYLWNAGSGSNSSPSGMATFGVFPGPTQRVYQREVY